MGNFFELFQENARLLVITLTQHCVSHGEQIPLAGVSHQAVKNYLATLVKHGESLVICK